MIDQVSMDSYTWFILLDIWYFDITIYIVIMLISGYIVFFLISFSLNMTGNFKDNALKWFIPEH